MSDWQELPWLYPPPGFQSFDFSAAIATPAPSLETPALLFAVPIGWDGVIRRISCNFVGGGFQQGSGQLIWRIYNNSRVVQNYGDIRTERGTLAHGREIDGIVVRAGNRVQFTVTCTDASLSGGTSVVCSAGGYFWPKQAISDQASK